MPHTSIQPSKRGASLGKLNPQQRQFVELLLADESFNATAAARSAGYKNPAASANQLLKNRAVSAHIGKALKERLDRTQLVADDVLRHLTTALYLDPLDLFERGEQGELFVRDLATIPQEVRRCITKIKSRTIHDPPRTGPNGEELPGRSTTYFEVELMSKDSMMLLAMKHCGLVDAKGSPLNVTIDPTAVARLLEEARSLDNVIDVVPKRLEGDNE